MAFFNQVKNFHSYKGIDMASLWQHHYFCTQEALSKIYELFLGLTTAKTVESKNFDLSMHIYTQ